MQDRDCRIEPGAVINLGAIARPRRRAAPVVPAPLPYSAPLSRYEVSLLPHANRYFLCDAKANRIRLPPGIVAAVPAAVAPLVIDITDDDWEMVDAFCQHL